MSTAIAQICSAPRTGVTTYESKRKVIPISNPAGTATQSLVPLARLEATPTIAEDCNPPAAANIGIPNVLLRPACDLEIVIPARNEVRRLPHTLKHTVQYLEMQSYTSSIVVVDN